MREDIDRLVNAYEAKKRADQKRMEQAENWERSRRVDQALSEGIRDGLTFDEYVRKTQCPGSLRERYQQLQQASGIVPGQHDKQHRDAIFLSGFNMDFRNNR